MADEQFSVTLVAIDDDPAALELIREILAGNGLEILAEGRRGILSRYTWPGNAVRELENVLSESCRSITHPAFVGATLLNDFWPSWLVFLSSPLAAHRNRRPVRFQ